MINTTSKFFIIFFIINVVVSSIETIIIVSILIKDNAHFEKFFTFISPLRLLHFFSKIFRKFKFIFDTVNSIIVVIIFTLKRAFLVMTNRFKKLIVRGRGFTKISVLFNVFHIITYITRIIVCFLADKKDNSLNNILDIIFRRVMELGTTEVPSVGSASRIVERSFLCRGHKLRARYML